VDKCTGCGKPIAPGSFLTMVYQAFTLRGAKDSAPVVDLSGLNPAQVYCAECIPRLNSSGAEVLRDFIAEHG
jgi:hypothetical protein